MSQATPLVQFAPSRCPLLALVGVFSNRYPGSYKRPTAAWRCNAGTPSSGPPEEFQDTLPAISITLVHLPPGAQLFCFHTTNSLSAALEADTAGFKAVPCWAGPSACVAACRVMRLWAGLFWRCTRCTPSSTAKGLNCHDKRYPKQMLSGGRG